ncbi:hypothetical protein CspeluHIS016_0600800 [Cutaneotrichosporon spelunceum]|uniref:Uncharacterized protein n=1 Tax=Cutaneotrichosporon spelunceum TaxID=1672016 RepID=A0AAD3TXM6_9TREE|nr:hypothetical protein CspeluHIS016_0600800 [Cutaneotrichosporon spelunceum]
MPKASRSTHPGPSSPNIPIYTRLGIPTRRVPPRTRHVPGLTKRVVLYDCQTPGHTVHAYVFETHLNGVPIPIDPAEDGALLARVRTPKCPLPGRQGVVRQVSRLKGDPALFGAPEQPEDEDDDDEANLGSRIEEAEESLHALQKRVKTQRTFALESEAFWIQHRLSALRLRRTALRAQQSPLLANLGNDVSSTTRALQRAPAVRVSSHAELREADYVAALLLAHITVLSLNAAAQQAQALGSEAVADEVAPLALLRLSLSALLEDAAFWDPTRRESQVTLRRWLQRWCDEAGADEGVEVGPLLDSLGVV